MNISVLALKLILILIPGIIATIIIDRLTIHKPWTSFKFSVNSILCGSISYLIFQGFYYFIYFFQNLFFDQHDSKLYALKIWQKLPDSELITYDEILMGSLISIIVGFFASWLIQYKVLNRACL